MSGFILGEKKLQTQTFTENGMMIPVTIVSTSPCFVTGFRWEDTDGYTAIQLGFGTIKRNAKPQAGILKKAGIETPLHFLREIRITVDGKRIVSIENEGKKGIKIGEYELYVGTKLTPNMVFAVGDIVDVSGESKGKGFQGVMKRHGFAGGPKTHGQSDRARAPGSIGSGTTPGRVVKGKRMAGRTGGARNTIKNLAVVEVSESEVKIKGLIPGALGGMVEIRTVDR